MKYVLTLILTICISVLFGQTKFVVDENAEIRNVAGSFNAIEVSDALHVYITKGETESIAVSASNDEEKQTIKTVIENNVLRVYLKRDMQNYKKSGRKSVYISYKNINRIKVSDASNLLIADELTTSSLVINLSDASVLKGLIKTDSLTIQISDASVAKLTGSANKIYVQCSDASSLNAYELITDYASVKASDASNVNLLVNNEIVAKASDASNITYKGSAVLKESKSHDASNISHVN